MASTAQDPGPDPLQALAAFAQLGTEPAHTDVDRVMRSLVEHDGWYVPAALATRLWPRAADSRVDLRGDPGAGGELHVFTDREAVMRAQRSTHGSYAGGVPGARLFASLGAPHTALWVNPSSPREHQWWVSAGAYDVAHSWAGAVRIERTLTALAPSDPPPVQALRGYPGYQVLHSHVTGEPVLVDLPGLGGPAVLAFIAPDRASAFLDRLGPARADAHLVTADGASAFAQVRDTAATAFVLNPGSPQPFTLARSDIEAVAAAPTDAAPPRPAAPDDIVADRPAWATRATGEVTRVG
ncbi:hypothetical protein GCM10009682_62550 [Luedemannella flava]|uniref:SseB protein N-terminal domain-containing protein n=1 Tax=Luedemannella flava TaxID=349316 RepID=A0ABP4YZX0_9ACTN